jgi:4a-hydroxytetrahydrobiopterin dehydratase
VKKLSNEEAQASLKTLKGWAIENGKLTKTLPFKDYHETMAFVNALAWISHRADHHPDLSVGYNKVRIEYSTHDAGGLTAKDFACAAQCDALFGS